MERLASVSRNLFVSVPEGPQKDNAPHPMAELVFVTIEQEYQPQMQKPLIEGGAPQFGLAKVPVCKTIRFAADKRSLHMLFVSISDMLKEMEHEHEITEDPHEPGPEPLQVPSGPSVIVTG